VRRHPIAVLAVASAILTAACATELTHAGDISVVNPRVTTTTGSSQSATAPSTSDASPTSGPTATATPAPALRWTACQKLQCATLDVPLDYADPSRGTVTLGIEKRPASRPDQRIGTLLVNPGGPGVPGTVLVDAAGDVYSQALLDRFDIVAWDPRGTGQSHAVVCVDDNDQYVSIDPTPNTAADAAKLEKAGEDLAAACQARSGDILPYVSTAATARDMDRIRQALGEAKISYFGFSYGSQLGATWASLFPATVRATVLDGAVSPTDTPAEQSIAQAKGFELAFGHFLDDCAQKSSCPFHNQGNPRAAYDALASKVDASPLPSPNGRPGVNEAVLQTAVVSALYSADLWPVLAKALSDAQGGDGSGLLSLYDDYRTIYGAHSLEGLLAITCLDEGPVPADQRAATDAAIAKDAPHFQGNDAFTIACEHWPVPVAPQVTIDGKGAGPIVVVGTTGDPATPLESTRGMAKALEQGRLVVNQGEGHTGYKAGTCVGAVVDQYLTDLKVPTDGTTCTA